MQPKISIIIPMYNVEKYLRRCLDSVLNQTFSDWQAICVDDGSPDNSGKIAEEYAAQDSRFVVVHKENGGLVSARKAGLSIAKGEYISNIDSDDWIEPDAYEHMYNIICDYHPDMICYSFFKDYGDLVENRLEWLDEGIYTNDDITNHFKVMVDDRPFYSPIMNASLCTKIIKRDLLSDFQLQVDNRIVNGEDDAVTLPLIIRANSIYVCKKAFYHYCVRKTSVSWEKRKDDLLRLGVLADHLKKNFVSVTANVPYEYRYKYYLYTMANFWLDMMDLADSYYLAEKKELPFWPDVKRNSNIVVYGKGLWASNLISVIEKTAFCHIVANVDSSDLAENEELLKKCNYNYIIIAIADGRIREKVKAMLREQGMSEEKICLLNKQSITEEIIPFI